MAERQAGGCRLVVAAAGYGKTTALRHWFPDPATRWHRGAAAVALIDDGPAALAAEAARVGTRQVVLDDLPRLPADRAHAFVDAAARLPGTEVALASRWPLGSGWSVGAPVTRVRPADLALSVDEVEALLATGYDLTSAGLAERVHAATAGWPALVHLTAETLALHGMPAGPLAAAVAEPGSLLANYVAEEVLGGLPVPLWRLVADVAGLAPVTAGLCAALGHPAAGDEVRLLARIGVLTGAGVDPDSGPQVVPVIAAVAVQEQTPVPATVLAMAAAWYDRHGPPRAAARAYRLAGDDAGCARVLAGHGDVMVTTGQPRAVAELVAALPDALRGRHLRLLHGDALRIAGDVAAAAQVYRSVAAAEPAWDAGLAWRMGLVHYLRGDQQAALADFARGHQAPAEPADEALLLAWTAAATARLGDAAAGTAHAWRAYQLATGSGHDGALATAHISLALCLGITGDQVGSAEHYEQALRVAEHTHDLVLLARILTNQSYHLVEQARYPEALAAAGRAVRYADAAGHANLHALATGNEADALAMLGRFDEAVTRYERVLVRYRRMGSRVSAAALVGLAESHRLRGWRAQARAAFEEAVRLADGGDSRELAVRGYAGLARVLLPDDPAAAAAAADEALRRASDDLRVPAVLAQGWVAVAVADLAAARRLAGEAAGLARPRGQRAGLAEALELEAAAEADPSRARTALREAHAIWTAAGATTNAARAQLALCRLPGASAEDRFAALVAAERLAAQQVATDLGAPADRNAVLVRTLGRFEVSVDGEPVPTARWQSRRARDLLRVLVTRRGRPVARGELCELLWPDDDPAKTGHRLSVLLSIVRTVLDPDRAFPADHYLVADAASVALDVRHLRVDVLEFLAAVAHGQRLFERGAAAEARTVLAAADRDYTADVFEDEPYADWAGPLREHGRAAHLNALRLLAEIDRAAGSGATALVHLLRLLERDPYDEPAHRAVVRILVLGGQHGEARRAFSRYREAMAAIGVRPPDEAILLAPAARSVGQ
jgi:DNA-binding SARP family transcriptional activator